MPDRIDLEQYYTAREAAEVLSKNSGKTINPAYVRMLTKYGKLTPKKISAQFNLYPKAQIDAYVVEDRGVKAAEAAVKRAGGPSKRRKPKKTEASNQPETNAA